MEGWEYALLSHDAKLGGGPAAYIESVRQSGYMLGVSDGIDIGFGKGLSQGHVEGAVVGVAAAVVVGGLTWIGNKAWGAWKERKEKKACSKRDAMASEGTSSHGVAIAMVTTQS